MHVTVTHILTYKYQKELKLQKYTSMTSSHICTAFLQLLSYSFPWWPQNTGPMVDTKRSSNTWVNSPAICTASAEFPNPWTSSFNHNRSIIQVICICNLSLDSLNWDNSVFHFLLNGVAIIMVSASFCSGDSVGDFLSVLLMISVIPVICCKDSQYQCTKYCLMFYSFTSD